MDATSTTGFERCGGTTWASTGEDPVDVAMCIDPQIDWKDLHVDCVRTCSTMTLLHGEGPAAGIKPITRITFGVGYGTCASGLRLRRFHLGNPGSPQISLYLGLDCAFDPWLGAHPVDGTLPDNKPFTAIMSIEGFAGDWLSADPIDPPRILGSFTGDLVGPFEAVHCAALDSVSTNCA